MTDENMHYGTKTKIALLIAGLGSVEGFSLPLQGDSNLRRIHYFDNPSIVEMQKVDHSIGILGSQLKALEDILHTSTISTYRGFSRNSYENPFRDPEFLPFYSLFVDRKTAVLDSLVNESERLHALPEVRELNTQADHIYHKMNQGYLLLALSWSAFLILGARDFYEKCDKKKK